MRALACLLAVALCPAPAHATAAHAPAPTGERIAVAVFSLTGQPLGEEAQAKLKASLRGGLGAAGFEVVADDEVDKAVSAGGVAGCDTLSCLRRIGELVLVRRVLKISVEVLGNTHVVSELSLVDLSDGKVVATARDNCDVCTMKEVNDGLSNAAAALRMQLEPPPSATPAAPAAATTPAVSAQAAAPRSRKPLWIGLAGASAGLAVAAAVTFGLSYRANGTDHCSAPASTGFPCNQQVDGVPGIVIGAIGMPLILLSGYFTYLALHPAPRRVSLAPSASGSALSLAW